MQTLDFVSGLHNCLEFSQPLSCLYQAMQTQFFNNKVNKDMRVRMTTITMIYNNTEKNPQSLKASLAVFFKKLHTVTVTPEQDNHFRKQIVYLKISLCILVKDKVSTPHIVVITAHCHKGYILLTGISMVWWIKRALQEYCFFVCFVFCFCCCCFVL